METSVVTVCCVDVNSKKSPIGSICVHYANELKNGVLAQTTRDRNWTNCSDRCDSGNSVKLLELEI